MRVNQQQEDALYQTFSQYEPGLFLYIVFICNSGTDIESEVHDRSDLNLPGKQLDLLQAATNYGT